MKKLILILLTIVISSSFTYNTAFSTGENNRVKGDEPVKTEQKQETIQEENNPEKEKEKEKEKANDLNLVSYGPEISAEAAFLINPSTNTVIYQKNADKRMYPASTTKIMTAYLALTKLDLSKELNASATAVDIDRDGSNMGLSQGEILTGKQLLESLMIHSANDAANVLAEAVSGSISAFVDLMNEAAKELGMKDTHFANPHGYHDENHYTTARDMAILAKKAMENETFKEMSSMTSLVIPPTNKYKTDRIFRTRNSLINPYSDISLQYRFATGIKTGHTSNAGYCFVGSAERNGLDLISVVFKSPNFNQSFKDTKALFEYAYSKYRMRTVIKGDEIASTCNVRWALGKNHLVLKTPGDVKALLPRDTFTEELLKSEFIINKKITAPIKEGDILGKAQFYYDGELVAETDLLASRSVSRNIIEQLFSYLLNGWFLAALGLLVVVILYNRLIISLRRRKKR